jgi:HemK-like putative methylase
MPQQNKREEEWLLDEGFHGTPDAAFFAARERLRSGEPLAYLIGHMPFGPLTISLASKPLIPRTETEYWVERVARAERNSKHGTTRRFLDLCAGSGCIGAYFLHYFPDAYVDFAEIDEQHHETIRSTLARNSLDASHTTIYGGDLFENIPTDVRYDLILSNPPYIDPELNRTDENVREYEPHQALYGGMHGMEIIERIITDAPRYLKADGKLVIEHEPEQCETIASLATKHGFSAVRHERDQYGIFRYSILTH